MKIPLIVFHFTSGGSTATGTATSPAPGTQPPTSGGDRVERHPLMEKDGALAGMPPLPEYLRQGYGDEHEEHVQAHHDELHGWMETAAQAQQDLDYYRGLLDRIGLLFGQEAFTADDGGLHDEVLRAKVPELVEEAMKELWSLRNREMPF